MSHLRALRIALVLLLPYMILAVGAEFMHHHHDGADCAACAWAGATISSTHTVQTVSYTEIVSAFVAPQVLPPVAEFYNSASPRAPPIG